VSDPVPLDSGETRVHSLASASDFLAGAEPLLLADEARHNLILGLAATIRDHPARYPEWRLWVAERGGRIVGAALRTPPHHLVLARPSDAAALDALVEALDEELPGVTAALPEADEFATAWSARTGVRPRRERAMRIHAAAKIIAAAGVTGSARPAFDDERSLVLSWYRSFSAEAVGEPVEDERLQQSVDHAFAASDAGFVVWDDGGPVSFAGYGGGTPNGVRIGPVYTPPDLRGRGYASALVAGLSQDRLGEGRTFCFLYTDLANPTANRLYARLGYEPVCDAAEIAFGA
jgi:uncharacterized protein